MARYTGADCRQCRREGCKLFLKGDRCFSTKCAMEPKADRKVAVAPGQHGAARKKVSEYGMQLREKQKTKRIYGLPEGQFRHYYDMADKMKGITGENMLSLIERRLDNVCYRMGVGNSRSMSRQLVSHGHVTVNGNTVDIPSYLVKAGDVIEVKENKRDNGVFKLMKTAKKANQPKWVSFDNETLKGKVLALPERSDVDAIIAEHMIVEFYSK